MQIVVCASEGSSINTETVVYSALLVHTLSFFWKKVNRWETGHAHPSLNALPQLHCPSFIVFVGALLLPATK